MPNDENAQLQFPHLKLCSCCKIRESRGLGYFNPAEPVGNRKHYPVCSHACLEKIMKLKGPPQEPSNSEQEAIETASTEAAEYITALGKTNLADFEADEWQEMIQGICMAFADKLQRKAAGEDIPL